MGDVEPNAGSTEGPSSRRSLSSTRQPDRRRPSSTDDRRAETGDRGVSTVAGYILHVALALLLVGGLVAGVGGLVDQQRERVVRDEFGVLGQRLAGDATSVDRLARVSDEGRVRLAVDLPRRVAGTAYRIQLRDTPDGGVVSLRSDDPAVTVRVSFKAATPVEPASERGGPMVLTYEGSSIRLGDGS